jgi:nicotinate-nucleotide adenylyltransferase
MKIGVFGGTFDPVHVGHLILAEQCREYAQLDRVIFIPAARPPHKPDRLITSFRHRLEMLQLAVAGHSAFVVDDLEKDRPGPSYTADTLRELQHRHPDARLVLLIGADCLPDLAHWHNPGQIGELAELLIMPRAGWSVDHLEQLRAELHLTKTLKLSPLRNAPLIDISSRDLRLRAAQERTLRYLVPRAVECYIETHGLYKGQGIAVQGSGDLLK